MHMATDTDIREALRHVVDSELGVNIVDLGLVYRIEVEGARARISMTTSPLARGPFDGLERKSWRTHLTCPLPHPSRRWGWPPIRTER